MQARFAGTCRDCGNKFPAGTDIDWQRGQGASCCNGSPQADKKTIVDRFGLLGTMQMEWVEGKTTQEAVSLSGDSVNYEERVYSGYNWMCIECRLVWGRQHQARDCGSRGHAASYEDTYGVKEVRNGVPTGPNMYTITRTAVRREKSTHNPGCDGSGSHANGCTFGNYESTSSHQPGCDGSGSHKDGCTNGPVPQVEEPAPACDICMITDDIRPATHRCKVCNFDLCDDEAAHEHDHQRIDREALAAPQADPQDMTSEQLWESMGPGTITTSWN